jgi:muconolactone delta-isomerase
MGQAVLKMAEYSKELIEKGKLEKHYHIVGKHGAAWICDVESNDELELILARSPVYNFAQYEIYALTEMKSGVL